MLWKRRTTAHHEPSGTRQVTARTPRAQRRRRAQRAGRLRRFESLEDRRLLAGIWLTHDEIMALPTSGPGWEAVYSAARAPLGTHDISNQDSNTDVYTLAKAIVGVRLGDQAMLSAARQGVMDAIDTEDGGRTLALARNLVSYVIAADIAGLDAAQDTVFRAWLRETLTENLSGRTLVNTHEDRPNNWGTHAGASRAAVAAYLGDTAELERTATVFRGYLGDRSAYAGFTYGDDLTWQADAAHPVGINPVGATKNGHSIDGVMPDDMRRGGSFQWPPAETGYPWEGMQGAVVQAEILYRQGYDAWNWQDQALLRSARFLYAIGWEAQADDLWQTYLINARYGTDYAESSSATFGKNMGWTSWTHQVDGGTQTNQPPSVNAGSDQSVLVTSVANLDGTVRDDGLPGPLTTTWTKTSGPGTVQFANAAAVDTTASFSAAGTYVLRLAASDGNLSAWDELTVVVTTEVTNQPPSVNAGSDQSVLVTSVANLDGTVRDDGLPGPLTTTWTKTSGPGTVQFANAAAVDTTASFSQAGSYVLRLTASDGALTRWDELVVEVLPSGGSTTLSFQDGVSPHAAYSGTQDTKIRGDMASTVFGTSNRLELDGNPDMSTLIRWDLSSVAPGTVVTAASVSLNVLNTSTATFELYAAQRPWTEASANFTLYDAGKPWQAAGAAGAGDRGATVLGVLTAPAAGPVTLALNAAGVAQVQSWINHPETNFGFIIQDYNNVCTDDLDTSSREASVAAERPKLTLTVSGTSANAPPTVNAGEDQAVLVSAPAYLKGTVTDDGQPNPVTTTWLKISGPGTVTFADASAVETTAHFSMAGTYVLRLSANDGKLTAWDELTITVAADAENQPPAVSAGSDQSVLVTSRATLDGTVSDDGKTGPVTTAWTKVSGPGAVTFGNASAVDTTAAFSVAGTYVLRLTAADGELTAWDELVVDVLPDAGGSTAVSFQDGVYPYASYDGTRDTKIRGDMPTSAMGSSNRLELDGNPDMSTLIRWDLSGLAPDSLVTSASLSVHVSNTSTATFEIYAALRPWTESGATFNTYATGLVWQTPGAAGSADRGTTVLGVLTAPVAGPTTVTLNAAGIALVQSWIAHPETNYGLIIQDYDNVCTDDLDFDSRETSVAAQRPKLTVEIAGGASAPLAMSVLIHSDGDNTMVLSDGPEEELASWSESVDTVWSDPLAGLSPRKLPQSSTGPRSHMVQYVRSASLQNGAADLADQAMESWLDDGLWEELLLQDSR